MNMDSVESGVLQFIMHIRNEMQTYPDFDAAPLEDQRAIVERIRKKWSQGGPRMRSTRNMTFDGTDHSLGIRIHYPEGESDHAAALIYIHGGGFTLFSNNTHDRLMREYAALGGFAVIGVDYPLSPEAKYPAALNAITELMLWLQSNAQSWGIDPARIAIGGDSAGGNLSFAVLMRLRDMDKHQIIRAILSNYGGFSPSISDASESRFGGPNSIMDRNEAEHYWRNYLRSQKDEVDPFAVPLLADLAGFPPVFLVIPELDLVAEHSFEMYDRLKAAGITADYKVYAGATHSFLEAMSVSDLARQGISDGAAFIKAHICG